MKKLCMFLVLFIAAQSFAQTVKFSSATPEVGKPISFEYNPKGGTLEKLTNVTCDVILYFAREGSSRVVVNLKKVGGIYVGEFTPLNAAQLAILVFSAKGTKDENPNGYFTKFYKNGEATAMSVFLEGHLYGGLGKGLAKMKVDLPKALELYAKAFRLDPNLKVNYMNNYLLTLYTIDKIKGEKAVYETIALYNKEPSEINLLKIAPLYNIINKKALGDSVNATIKLKYPIGAYALSLETRSLRLIKEAYKREERFNEIVRDFKLDLSRKNDLARANWFFDALGQGFADINNFDKATFYFDKFEPKSIRAIYYHKIAQKNLADKVNLEFAEKISEKTVMLMDSMRQEPLPQYYPSSEEYMKYIDELAVPYQITYVKILSELGKLPQGLTFVKNAVTKNSFGSSELNSLYVSLTRKNGKDEEVVKYAEQFVRKGDGNSQIKADLKMVYKGAIPFEIYYAGLEEESNKKQREEFLKEMINIPAPKFTLTNLKGERVDLVSLKGKVVVIDYWATWCGPCIASFPGMQMAVDKYKNNPNVVFLFINTLERQESKAREKTVRDWMAANPKYNFNVLLDTKSISDPADYDVVSKYNVEAIPTKFIIDGNGNIRFRKVGSSDVTETIVKELDTMIALVKAK